MPKKKIKNKKIDEKEIKKEVRKKKPIVIRHAKDFYSVLKTCDVIKNHKVNNLRLQHEENYVNDLEEDNIPFSIHHKSSLLYYYTASSLYNILNNSNINEILDEICSEEILPTKITFDRFTSFLQVVISTSFHLSVVYHELGTDKGGLGNKVFNRVFRGQNEALRFDIYKLINAFCKRDDVSEGLKRYKIGSKNYFYNIIEEEIYYYIEQYMLTNIPYYEMYIHPEAEVPTKTDEEIKMCFSIFLLDALNYKKDVTALLKSIFGPIRYIKYVIKNKLKKKDDFGYILWCGLITLFNLEEAERIWNKDINKNNRFFISEYKLYTSTKNKYKNYDLDTPTADKYYLSLATIRYAKKNTEEVMTRVAEKF